MAGVSAEDRKWMQAALALAERSVGLASPNPTVGCVIVKQGALAGQGWHEYDFRDHAEVVALREAGEKARAATAYVTLEPCSHRGRTGPCADALIAAGIGRVVVATADPNPLVSGTGLSRLRAAGIDVLAGVEQERAQRLNDGFARYIQTGLPLVALKAAISRDGRIAPPPSERRPSTPFWITSEQSRARVQEMRHASDALITGIGTVIADDPLLSDRTGLRRRRNLLRVVLDSELRLATDWGLQSKLVRSAEGDVLVFCTTADAERRKRLEVNGIRVERIEENQPARGKATPRPANPGPAGLSAGTGRVPLQKVIAQLGKLQITTVMIEAGAQINTSAFTKGVLDRTFLFQSTQQLGAAGVPLLYGTDDSLLANPPSLLVHLGFDRITQQQSGPDILFEASRSVFWPDELSGLPR